MTDDERFAEAMANFDRLMDERRARMRQRAEERHFAKARREEMRKRRRPKQPLPSFTPM